jgi:hypothetical protein
MKLEQTECSETLAYKIQMSGNNPEESIRQMFVVATFQQMIHCNSSGSLPPQKPLRKPLSITVKGF